MITTGQSRWNQLAAAGGLVVLCAIAISSLQLPKLGQLQSSQIERSEVQLKREVAQESLELKLLQIIPDFGFDNLIANWAFIKFSIYFGDDPAREQTGYDLSPEYFQIALTEDPRFIPAYFGLSASVSLYSGQPEISVAMMQKGLQQLSSKDPYKGYYGWRYLGVDQLLFLGEGQAARQSFEKAAEWASEYSDPESESIVVLSTSTAEFLASNPNSKRAQFQAWVLVYQNASDRQIRDRAIAGIRSVGGVVEEMEDGNIVIQPPSTD